MAGNIRAAMLERAYKKWVMGLGMGMGLVGCVVVGPDHEVPAVALPEGFSSGGVEWKRREVGAVVGEESWWRMFGDAELDGLVERAMGANQELAGAGARLRQAREMSKAARSRYIPDMDLGASAERSKIRMRMPGGGTDVSNAFGLPVDLRYEVDVWGKVARQVESAEAMEAAAGESLRALRLTVAGEVAQTYWALRAVDANRAVVARALEIRMKALELLRKRREVGEISGLDLARAETEVATADADRLQLEQERVRLVNALAVLTGRAATGMQVGEKVELPAPPKVPVDLPSEVMRRRPDVRAAERRVAAANAEVGVAAAAFYPAFRIDASGGLDAEELSGLFDASSLVWSLGANAMLPITERKLLKAQQRAEEEAHAVASAEYRQVVLESLREVEDALQAAVILERRQRSQDLAVAAAEKTFELSAKQFRVGLVSFLDVVDAERTRLEAERLANLIRAERLAVAVALAKAVGGNWRDA